VGKLFYSGSWFRLFVWLIRKGGRAAVEGLEEGKGRGMHFKNLWLVLSNIWIC